MRKQVITGFIDISRWRFALYDATYGAAVAGNTDAREDVRYPDEDLTSRVRITHPYYREMALRLAETNRLWQRSIGRVSAYNNMLTAKLQTLLSCPLAAVRLADQPVLSHPCHQYHACPSCHHRQLVRAYGLFSRVSEPGMLVYEHTLTAYSMETRRLDPHMAYVSNQIMGKLYHNKKLPWRYGMAMTTPEWVPATEYADSMWRMTTRTLALVEADTRVETDPMRLSKTVDRNGAVYEEDCRFIGEVSPTLITNTLSKDFRYTPALLYTSTDGQTLWDIHTAFRGGLDRGTCRVRTYGLRCKNYELEEKGSFDVNLVECEKQRFCWRPSFAATDLDQPAGDQAGLVRLPYADHRVLRG